MSHDGGSDMAANAWPGFVDILSAVVIMFVFFVLITAAVLYFYTITYTAKENGKDSSVTELQEVTTDSPRISELVQENQKLREEVETLSTRASQEEGASESEKSKEEKEVAQAFTAQSSEQKVVTSNEDMSLVLFHDPGAITVDLDTKARITAFVEDLVKTYGAENLEIVLNSPKVANASRQSRAKRRAVARMLNVRNTLLESAANREKIQLKVVENEAIEDSDSWTRIKVNIRQ